MSGALIVVDMQPNFKAANAEKTQLACIREIKKAIKNKDAIVFVEYANQGSTLPVLTNVVKNANYKRVFHVTKWSDDGGREVISFLRQKHLPRLNLRVVGVNTPYCVAQTVNGMRRLSPHSTVSVVADACNSEWGQAEHKHALAQMSKAGVRVLNSSKKK